MTFLNKTIFDDESRIVKEKWQPKFPLKYSGVYGPYEPITQLEESLQKNFENLLMTSPGEWPMNPDLGVGLRRYLFERHGSPMLVGLQSAIQRQLDKYLPHIDILSVDTDATEDEKDNNFAKITIRYSIMKVTVYDFIAQLSPVGALSITQETIQAIAGNRDPFNGVSLGSSVLTI